jgi:hypothetical protein
LADVLLVAIDVLEVDFTVVAISPAVDAADVLGGTLFHSDEMVDKPPFDPKLTGMIFFLLRAHLIPRKIDPILNF